VIRGVERQQRLEELLAGGTAHPVSPRRACCPLYATHFGQGFGTLYTADYRPGDRFAGAPGTSPFAFSWCP